MPTLHSKHFTLQNALKLGRSKLDAAGIHSSALEARLLLEFACSTKHDDPVPKDVLQRFLDLIEQRTKRIPIAHLLGKKEFYSLEFTVNSNVLIPRPDSEVLIDEALRHFDKNSEIRILDLGVGSGCLLLTLLKHFPNASGVGIDISDRAIETAKYNYAKLELKNRMEFIVQDWKDLPATVRPERSEAKSKDERCDPSTSLLRSYAQGERNLLAFDLILSNPPYIPSSHISDLEEDVKLYEPHVALDGGQDGLKCYREILPIISSLLSDNGIALIESGFDQNEQIIALTSNHNLQPVKTLYDLNGIKRGLCIRKKI